MLHFLWLVVALPFASAAVLALFGSRLSRSIAAFLGAGSIGLAAIVSMLIGFSFLSSPPPGNAYTQHLWTWMSTGGFQPEIAFYLDPVSLLMLLVITFVSFLIHLYSAEYMHDDAGYARFFAYMNLFVASMLTLILANNLLLLYLGWEGVGLCSFLLIGFWYQEPANVRAAGKAFIVTRFGDTAFAVGLFLLFTRLGTLDIQELMHRASEHWAIGSGAAIAAAALLLGGAVGKSAQLPLQTWLPDAMAGPTPVSALIHAATMVTAGVYLIARTHGLFELAPYSLEAVGVIGATTLLLASCAALVQSDIKRILAYSTMSQIGYMFLALGCAAWSASIFHLMTHAFFKALLFLTAGAVILACHHEQDIFKMGGLRKQLPLEYACFLVGGLALAAFPWVTAGYYSKDEILWEAYAGGHFGLFLAGLVGAFLTPLYTFRLIFTVFHGEAKIHAHRGQGVTYWLPLAVLLVFSTFVGGMIHPPLAGVLPAAIEQTTNLTKLAVGILSSAVALAGIAVACGLFLGQRRLVAWLAGTLPRRMLAGWWVQGWGFDWLYDRLLLRPLMWFARVNSRDGIDLAILTIPAALRAINGALVRTETGRIRWYAAGMAAGAVLVVAMVFV